MATITLSQGVEEAAAQAARDADWSRQKKIELSEPHLGVYVSPDATQLIPLGSITVQGTLLYIGISTNLEKPTR